MSVAQQYPARTDTNGTTWYRPADTAAPWGWTADPEQAHPDYADVATMCHKGAEDWTPGDRAAVLKFQAELVARAATQEEPVTELTPDGPDPYPRRSEFCGFPLPPFPEQVNVSMDGFQRYKLPSPTTGKLTAYTRMTTVSKVTSDTFNLDQWKIREKVRATLECRQACVNVEDAEDTGIQVDSLTEAKARAFYDYLKHCQNDDGKSKNKDINIAIDAMHDLCGGAEAREHGGAVHDWLAELAMGRVLFHQIPEQYQVHAAAYQDAMARAGLIDIPEYTERLVLNMKGRETIAGRLDGIAYSVVDGEYVLIDRKTSKTLDFSWLEYGIQFAGYGFADLMLLPDRAGWAPMPKLAGVPHFTDHAEECPDNQQPLFGGDQCETCGAAGDDRDPLAYCIHVPSDQPERSQVVPFRMLPGAAGYATALQVREDRRSAEKTIGGAAYPIPTEEALRYVAARQRLQNLQDHDDAIAIMEEYEDVWDDELAEFGATCYGLLNTDTNTEE